MSPPELIYFNGRGRGEIIRLVFAATGTEYKDTRIEIDQWPGTYKAGNINEASFSNLCRKEIVK